MYCSKCGCKIKEHAKFCENCGNQLKYEKTSITDQDLEAFYIGDNYQQIKNTKFSLPTFFLGTYYFLYRKMWLYTFIWILLKFLIMTFIKKTTLSILIIFILSFIISILFPKIYFHFINKKITKIKQKTTNLQDSLDKCKKEGGVSVVAVILYFVAYVCILLFIFFYYLFGSLDAAFNMTPSELNYEIPNYFIASDRTTKERLEYYYVGNQDFCTISIDKNIYPLMSEEQYLNIKGNNPIQSVNIHGITWKYMENIEDSQTTYYYAVNYKNKLYGIRYTIYQDSHNLCTTGYNKFIQSLTFSNTNNNFDYI